MKRKPALAEVKHWGLRRLASLHEAAEVAATLPTPVPFTVLCPLVLDFHSVCATFLRSYYLSSATGATTAAGTRVTTTVPLRSHRDAMTFAVHRTKRLKGTGPWSGRDEPTWHDSAIVIRLLRVSGCSNWPGVAAAWSVGTNALPHLTTARNYFAHRSESTAIKLRRLSREYSVAPSSEPSTILVQRAPGRPQSILEDWFDDMAAVFGLMPG